jgi:hypothetical protein
MEKHSGRSKNFSTSEVNLLVRLVDSNKKVVESKKTGAVTNREKGKMWEKIALSFNSQTTEGINREAKVLKEKWTNLKRVAVKNHAADKKFRQGTTGCNCYSWQKKMLHKIFKTVNCTYFGLFY